MLKRIVGMTDWQRLPKRTLVMSLADQRMHAVFGQWPNRATGSGSVKLTNFVTRTIAPEKYVS